MSKKPTGIKATQGSSHVTAHSFNPDTKELDITFHGSRKYRYHDVTARQYEELQKHHSPGGFLHAHIIGKCDCTKLDN